MSHDPNLPAFKKTLLLVAPLLIAAVSLPMALGLVPPNGVYGFRTPASLASPEAWYSSNLWAGRTGVVLGLAGAILTYRMLKNRPANRDRRNRNRNRSFRAPSLRARRGAGELTGLSFLPLPGTLEGGRPVVASYLTRERSEGTSETWRTTRSSRRGCRSRRCGPRIAAAASPGCPGG